MSDESNAEQAPTPEAEAAPADAQAPGGQPAGGQPAGGTPAGGTPAGGQAPPDPSAELAQQLHEATARLKTVSAAYKNLQEEMHAFRARLERQQTLNTEILKGEVVSRLFEPLENLRRTIDALHAAKIDPGLSQGLELVHRAFLEGFHGLGLEELGHVGEPFNPDQHEALTLVPVPAAEQDGRIVQVFSKGFRVGTRVIRPARVVVGQYTAPGGEA